MADWVSSQKKSSLHILAVVLFSFVVFLSYQSTVLLVIGFVAFFLVTSFKMIWKMLFIMLVVGVIVMVLPFLAPIALIVMIVLFIMRIGYVISNWRPFVSGLFVYGSSIFLWGRVREYMYYGGSMEPIIMAIMSGVVMHFLLVWLYQNGYSSYSALGIMGSVPLIIISFVLPFLKMHVSLDAFGEPYAPEYSHATETATTQTRTTYVEPYIRTAPDGDPTNNLSYKGTDAKPPNMANLQVVEGHYRTLPDGDPTNNLSYQSSQHMNYETLNPEIEGTKQLEGGEKSERYGSFVYVPKSEKK